MRRTPSALRAAGAVAVVCAALAVPTAQAQAARPTTATWTVTPGGYFGTEPYTSNAPETGAAKPTTYLVDDTTGVKFACDLFDVQGYLDKGSGLPSHIGRETSFEDSGPCRSAGLTVRLGNGNPTDDWPIAAESYDAATGTTYGLIRDADIVAVGAGCAADLTGTLDWHLVNDGSVWSIKGTSLTAAHVTGCAGVISNGDALTLTDLHFVLHSGSPGNSTSIVSP